MKDKRYSAVVIGASAGGIEVLATLLKMLPDNFELCILVVQHLHPAGGEYLAEYLGGLCRLPVKEAMDKEPVTPGNVYIAPANYHLLVEKEETLALSTEEKVNWARPSIDVLFESAARAFGEKLVGILLSGANSDGAEGMHIIKQFGGLTIAQDPETAAYPVMPMSAVERGAAKQISAPEEIAELLVRAGTPSLSCDERKPFRGEGM
jgi:two-component system, chemotaxis family, protein-glutamate methylesterase/glutaminase